METDKKYKLTDEFITFGDRKLYRIEALKDFSDVKKGDKGGFVESEYNLSQKNNCWVYDDAKVYEDAKIFSNARIYGNTKIFWNAEVYGNAVVWGNARIYGNAEVFGNANVYDNAWVFNNATIYGNAKVHGNAVVCGNAKVYGNAAVYSNAEIFSDATVISDSDYIVFKNWWSSGRCFTWTRSNNMWKVGCFYGTGEELIAKAYKDSELSGREYKKFVKYVETILKDGNTTTIVNKIKQCLLKIVKKFNL